jgi:hypothetical protein
VHAAHWAQAGVTLAADLLDGRSDGRTHAPGQVDRAVDAVRAAGATGKILFRYADLGSDWHTRRLDPERRTRELLRQLKDLGHQVTLTPAAA